MTDVLIIGGGPAGLSAAVYAKRAGMDVLVTEKAYAGTGQMAESNRVDNYLGFPAITGYDLGEKFREHAISLDIEIQNGDVGQLVHEAGVWRAELQGGEILEAETVIYAAGAAHRHLGIPGEREYSGKGVSYCAACDGAFFRGKTAAVIGGGDTAVDDAMYLSDICKKVYLVHRRNEFRGAAGTVEQLRKKENVEFVLRARPAEIAGTDRVQGLGLEDGRTLAVDAVFVAAGMTPATDLVKGLVKLDENGYIVADETGKTSAYGFFAAGDVRKKTLRQIVTAVSDGANAATSAVSYIRGRRKTVTNRRSIAVENAETT